MKWGVFGQGGGCGGGCALRGIDTGSSRGFPCKDRESVGGDTKRGDTWHDQRGGHVNPPRVEGKSGGINARKVEKSEAVRLA